MRTIQLSALALACCAGTVNVDETSAENHRREAQKERALAREHLLAYDPERVGSESIVTPGEAGVPFLFPVYIYNPTSWHLFVAEEHREHARQHEAAARELERFEESECKDFPPESRVACPLIGGVVEVVEVPGGVRLRFVAGVPLDAIVAHMRWHYAYARAHGFEDSASCPLYVRGLRIELVDDSAIGAIELGGTDRRTIREIRKRVRAEISPPPKGATL